MSIDLNKLELTDEINIVFRNGETNVLTVEDCHLRAINLNLLPQLAITEDVKIKRDNTYYELYDLCRAA